MQSMEQAKYDLLEIKKAFDKFMMYIWESDKYPGAILDKKLNRLRKNTNNAIDYAIENLQELDEVST